MFPPLNGSGRERPSVCPCSELLTVWGHQDSEWAGQAVGVLVPPGLGWGQPTSRSTPPLQARLALGLPAWGGHVCEPGQQDRDGARGSAGWPL